VEGRKILQRARACVAREGAGHERVLQRRRTRRAHARGRLDGGTSEIALWNVRGRKVVAETLPAGQGEYITPVFGGDGTRLAMVGADGTVKLWRARDRNPLAEGLAPRGTAYTTAVALGPHGTAAVGDSSSLTIWGPRCGEDARSDKRRRHPRPRRPEPCWPQPTGTVASRSGIPRGKSASPHRRARTGRSCGASSSTRVETV
jgi:WD40 repeat protein